MSLKMSSREANSRKKSKRHSQDGVKPTIEDENDESRIFNYLMSRHCDEYGLLVIPEINGFICRDDGDSVKIDQPVIMSKNDTNRNLIINTYCNKDSLLKKVTCKALFIDTKLLMALNKTIASFSFVCSLRLEYCGLTSEHVKLLQEALQNKQGTLKELSLKGNPNPQQNFYLLIGCGLQVLNLKLCCLDKYGLKMIAEEFLKLSPNSSIIHLDLSSNWVFDDGCQPMAGILRCDRNLLSLNLSDCKITDEGFKHIIGSFSPFSLDNEEILARRKLRFEYFSLLQKTKNPTPTESRLSHCQDNNEGRLIELENILKRHPFTCDSVPENGQIICKGNFTLESLNLAYNHLSRISLDAILKTLITQTGQEKGLQRLILEGNRDQNCTEVVASIEEFLICKKFHKSSGSIRSRSSLKKRKSSGVSSVGGTKTLD